MEQSQKKPYQQPRLTMHGDVVSIVQAQNAGGAMADGGAANMDKS
jgi:hypothetical protein